MKLHAVALVGCVLLPAAANAGGLFLPGSGAVSTSRAGAAIASVDDGEALSINPAGLAKTKGTTITLSMAFINYVMEFNRRGTYDPIADEALPYEGMAYPTVKNDASPPLGIGRYQPLPVFAVASDLGGKVPGLTAAIGVFAPSGYPFRDMCTELDGGCKRYTFNADYNQPPPPQRYDIVKQEGAIVLPSIAASYRITPDLDVGARFSAGWADIKSTTMIWANLDNYSENVKNDAEFTVDATDKLIMGWGLGLTFRPTPVIELAANYSSKIHINAKGSATSENGPGASINGLPFIILPTADGAARCATGGTREAQKACIEFELPMTATVGGRYKVLGKEGRLRGDIELNLGWENWGSELASDYRVVVDGDVYAVDANNDQAFVFRLKDNPVRHGLQDTFSVRLGGSFRIPQGETNEIILRGGVGHDTAAAKQGWLRSDLDGAARTTLTIGAGYRAKRWEVNVGGGAILEGSPDNPGMCNPTGPAQGQTFGCAGGNMENPIAEREGPDPITPVSPPGVQTESPVTQGTYSAHYVLFMLGFSTWF
ncbi:MAG: outer membrane protein transport protein [Deltaproteobacteria bacterium]|nr:outer membrane protein transport protein [Deltaproteobacteria bacterium]